MDREATELAKAGLRLFSKEMSPEYELVRKKLLGYLATHGSTVEQLAQKEVNDRTNVALLSAFTRVLPMAHYVDHRWQFISNDPYKVRNIQSNVVWHPEPTGTGNGLPYRGRPYYLLGKSGQKKDTVWLLACAGANNHQKSRKTPDTYDNLFYFHPDRNSRNRLVQLDEIAKSEYPSPEDMSAMFNLERHNLWIGPDSPGSTIVQGRGIYDFSTSRPPLVRISDIELGQFDVMSHLNRIATAFKKQGQLAEMLTQDIRELTKNRPIYLG